MTGDQADVHGRLKALIPPWFGTQSPVLDGFLQGPAWALAQIYSLIAYAKLQTRIRTAIGGWLDLISADFYGTGLIRKAGQGDDAYRTLILAGLFRERNTRKAIHDVVLDLTGFAPIVREPLRDVNYYGGPGGYSTGIGYGSTSYPFQVFVEATRSQPGGAYAFTTDSDIYAGVESVRPAGVTFWTRLADPPAGAGGALDFSDLDNSALIGH